MTGAKPFSITGELELDASKVTSSKISFYARGTLDVSNLTVLFSLTGATGHPLSEMSLPKDTNVIVRGDADCVIEPRIFPKGENTPRGKVTVQAIAWWPGAMYSWPITREFEVCDPPKVAVAKWTGEVIVTTSRYGEYGAVPALVSDQKNAVVYSWADSVPEYPVIAGTNCFESTDGTIDLSTSLPDNAADVDSAVPNQAVAEKNKLTLRTFSKGCLPSTSIVKYLAWGRIPTPEITVDELGVITVQCDDKAADVYFAINGEALSISTNDLEKPAQASIFADSVALEDKIIDGKPFRYSIGNQRDVNKWEFWAEGNDSVNEKNVFLMLNGDLKLRVPISIEGDVLLQARAYRQSNYEEDVECSESAPWDAHLPSEVANMHFDAIMCEDPDVRVSYVNGELLLTLSSQEEGSTIYWRPTNTKPVLPLYPDDDAMIREDGTTTVKTTSIDTSPKLFDAYVLESKGDEPTEGANHTVRRLQGKIRVGC